MIREAQRCCIIIYLPKIVSFSENSITPSWYASLFPRTSQGEVCEVVLSSLRGVIVVRTIVVLVGGKKGDVCLGVEWERVTSNHLKIELFLVNTILFRILRTIYLIIVVQCAKIS